MSTLSPQEITPDVILAKLADLEAALLKTQPDIKLAGHQLHKDLQARPDLIHILRDEDMAIIFKAAMAVTQQVITTENEKAKKGISGKTSAQLGKLTAADLL
jgi:hypothetical protein